MSRKSLCIWALLILALFILPFKQASAQDELYIEAIYPQQGSPGEFIDMLVRGGGFESRQSLNAILLNYQEIPILDIAVLTDDAIKVQFFIPEDIETRETEIRFIFNAAALDAAFNVTERRNGPFIADFSPQAGQIDTQVPITFAVNDFFLGEFGGIVIGYEEIPVLDYSSSSSTQAWEFLTYLPTFLPLGDDTISLYFETYTFSSYFFVSDSPVEGPTTPSLYGYEPNESLLDSSIEFILHGYAVPELGDLKGIAIENFELPIDYYEIISDEAAAAITTLPPNAPLGENRIIFTFENYRYTDTIYTEKPKESFEAPVLFTLEPQEARNDTGITLRLEGENLRNLGTLTGVRIGQFFVQEADFKIESNNEVSVFLYLPENTPLGEHTITVSFENAEIRENFLVTDPRPPLWLVLLAIAAGLGGLGVIIRGGYAVARAIRKGSPDQKDPRDDRKKPPAELRFNLKADIGIQTIETGERPLIGALDFHFDVTDDPGEQTIEPEDDSLVEG